MMRLYEENGVYNFYLKANTEKGKVEALSEDVDVKALSREELEKEALRLRRLGFPRQPLVQVHWKVVRGKLRGPVRAPIRGLLLGLVLRRRSSRTVVRGRLRGPATVVIRG